MAARVDGVMSAPGRAPRIVVLSQRGSSLSTVVFEMSDEEGDFGQGAQRVVEMSAAGGPSELLEHERAELTELDTNEPVDVRGRGGALHVGQHAGIGLDADQS